MVDTVQERNDDAVADPIGWHELERGVELRRLRGDPEDVDLSVEQRRRRHLHVEVAEQDALDSKLTSVGRERLGSHEEHHVPPGARESSAEEAAHAANSEDAVPHRRIVAESRTWCTLPDCLRRRCCGWKI
jgi:hypothetical protein